MNAERFTSDDYHNSEGLSQSALKQFLRDPALYRQGHMMTPTASMLFGTDVDNMIFGRPPRCHVVPEEVLSDSGQCRGKPYTEWKKTRDESVDWLNPKDFRNWSQPVFQCVQSILSCTIARNFLQGDTGESHVQIRWTDEETGLLLRCEIDRADSSLRMLGDLKTTVDPSPAAFSRQAVNLGYDIQAAWYTEAWRQLTGDELPFIFIAAKNKPSYHVEIFTLDDEFLAMGREKMRSGLRRFVEAKEADHWQTPTSGKVIPLSMPNWAKYQPEYEGVEA